MLISRRNVILLLCAISLLSAQMAIAQSEKIREKIENASWEVHEIVEGASWKQYHFNNLFDSKQSITVLHVDFNQANFEADIPYVDSGFVKTSDFAVQKGAFAAINGSYFNTKKGGSVVTFYKHGLLIDSTREDFPMYRDNAGFSIDQKGSIAIVRKPEAGWQVYKPYTLLTSGPLLVYEGQILSQENEKFNTNRHPRTAVGITRENQLIAITVDGRSSMAHGMTTVELAEVMAALGCQEAMNLDGGGSTTMWIRDQPENGVVNFPSDNKIYDHGGERKVANSLLFILK